MSSRIVSDSIFIPSLSPSLPSYTLFNLHYLTLIMWTFENKLLWAALIAILQVRSWVSATSRPFAPYDGVHQLGQSPQFSPAALDSQQGFRSTEGVVVNEEAYTGMSKLGSRPPSCEHKCGGCIPCDAIQVPTTTDHLGVQYANYEPEGWKCKCGSSFFNP